MAYHVLILPGDGIGPEVVGEARRIMTQINSALSIEMQISEGLLGGAAIDATGVPYPDATAAAAKESDAILLGAVGGPKWDSLEPALRPERGLLAIRSDLGLFGNLRPAILYPQLAGASSLKPDLVAGLDLLIVRELTGGIYFGQPRGFDTTTEGERRGYNTDVYSESEIRRVAHLAFSLALKRGKRVCSVDKANVLEVTMLWREILIEVAREYPEVELSHMYVDNAAMQLIRAPKQFDVMVTGNLFGDILSDAAAMLTGSIGMLPSASLDQDGRGLYEPCHGSAPDIAGLGVANPLATILSVAMMYRYSLDQPAAADLIEKAVGIVLDQGFRTGDIASENDLVRSTQEMGSAVSDALASLILQKD